MNREDYELELKTVKEELEAARKELDALAIAEQQELDCKELEHQTDFLDRDEIVELYVSLARETGKLRHELDCKF